MRSVVRESSNSTPARETQQVSKDPNRPKLLLKRICGAIRDRSMMTAVRTAERVAGPACVPLILLPWIMADALSRARDYSQFRRLRASLPPDFWRGSGPLRHYLRMITHWQRSLALSIIADRLNAPRWQTRVQVHGAAPNELSDWGKRPVVLACLHTGGYVLLRHWMRANGIVAASLVMARPGIVRRYEEQLRALAGNGVRLPYFFRVNDVRAAIRFLTPGRVLIVAVDARGGSHTVTMGAPFRVNDGAARLARLTRATLLPASIWLKRRGGMEIRFGSPVPQEMVESADTHRANEFLAQEFWKDLARDPCAVGWTTLEAYAVEDLIRARRGFP